MSSDMKIKTRFLKGNVSLLGQKARMKRKEANGLKEPERYRIQAYGGSEVPLDNA